MPTESVTYRFDCFTLDVGQRQLWENGVVLPLRARAFDVLVALVSRAGRLVSKDELLEIVWPKLVVEENNLQVYIAALRKLVGREAIATVPGRGYRFLRPVEGMPLEGQGQVDKGGARIPPDSLGATSFASRHFGAPVSYIPELVSELIGRDHDVEVLIDWLRRTRLVTIVGPGGIGKTRLMQSVGRQALQEYPDGVIWVELAPLTDPALVLNHIATALGFEAEGVTMEVLLRELQSRSLLLLLDNAEHLVQSVAQVVDALLRGTPNIKILVTSQMHLALSSEQVYRLDALGVPLATTNLEEALRHGAVAFFVARAKASDRRFEINDTNVGTVIDVCRRLDGIPLALELAVARLPFLGLATLASRLDERFRVLGAGNPNAPKRQQTLVAVFDWSHRLLNADEQMVFRRLSLLTGPFTLEQACAVVSDAEHDEWAVIDLLGTLVDRSLVAVEGEDAPGYRLLDTGRIYALEKMRLSGEMEPIARACRMYEAAGERAVAASTNAQALVNLSAARDLVAMLPASTERAVRELDVILKLGPALQTALGPADARCEALYRRAVELARQGNANETAFKALWGYWYFLCMNGRDRDAAPYADEISRMARILGDDGLELEACHAVWTTQQLLGNAPAMVVHALRAIALYDCKRHHHLTFSFGGHDPGICALGQGSVGLWLTGFPDQALEMANQALKLGTRVEHGYSRAVGFYFTAFTFAVCGRIDELQHSAEGIVALSKEQGMEMVLNEGQFFLGCAHHARGSSEIGIQEMRATLKVFEASGHVAFVLFYISLLAEALLAREERPEAQEEAMTFVMRGIDYAESGQGFFLPELYRLRGELNARKGEGVTALTDFRLARDLADTQGAVSLALRAAMSLLRYEGKPSRDDLQRRISGFSEGADTQDLVQARALLCEQ